MRIGEIDGHPVYPGARCNHSQYPIRISTDPDEHLLRQFFGNEWFADQQGQKPHKSGPLLPTERFHSLRWEWLAVPWSHVAFPCRNANTGSIPTCPTNTKRTRP